MMMEVCIGKCEEIRSPSDSLNNVILGFLRIAEFATHWFCEASQDLLNDLEIYALW